MECVLALPAVPFTHELRRNKFSFMEETSCTRGSTTIGVDLWAGQIRFCRLLRQRREAAVYKWTPSILCCIRTSCTRWPGSTLSRWQLRDVGCWSPGVSCQASRFRTSPRHHAGRPDHHQGPVPWRGMACSRWVKSWRHFGGSGPFKLEHRRSSFILLPTLPRQGNLMRSLQCMHAASSGRETNPEEQHAQHTACAADAASLGWTVEDNAIRCPRNNP